MSIKFCSLSSGSSGNCQYIETDNSRILIDAGFSGKRIEELLSSIGVNPSTIDCIFVTHEHVDHIKGIGILSRRYDIPIYANEKTWVSMDGELGKLKDENIKVFETGEEFQLKDLDFCTFSTSHDAVDPVGYCIYNKKTKISIITDTGWVNDNMKEKIRDSQLYLIESNHDIKMLKEGKYPWPLKQRILSKKGHLSNEAAGITLKEVLKGEREVVLLGHLSKENNIPLLAYNTVKNIIESTGINIHKDIILDLTYRDRTTKVYNL